MKRIGACLAVFVLLRLAASAQTLPELFQKAKAQVKGESWTDALKTLERLEAEAARPGNEGREAPARRADRVLPRRLRGEPRQAEKAQADFAAFLALQPNATMDPSMYSKKAIAAFRGGARLSTCLRPRPADGRPAMFAAFQEFKLPPNSGEQVNEALGRRSDPLDHDGRGEADAGRELSFGGGAGRSSSRSSGSRAIRSPAIPDNSYQARRSSGAWRFADAHFVQAEGDAGQHDGPRHGVRPARAADLRRAQAAPRRRRRLGRGGPGRREVAEPAMRCRIAGPTASSSGHAASAAADTVHRSGDAGHRLRPQLARGLALPQGAPAQGRPLPAGRRRVHHPEGLRRRACCSATRRRWRRSTRRASGRRRARNDP